MIYKMMEMLEMLVPMLMGVAFLTLGESKLLGAMQSSVGPQMIGSTYGAGILQPFSDALKLMLKENMLPLKSNKWLYKLGPFISLALSFIMWIMMPINDSFSLIEDNYGILLVLSISSLAVYGLMYSGWSSNSSYGLLGSLSSMSQLMSYEMSMGVIIIIIIIISNSFNLLDIMYNQMYIWNMFPLLPMGMLFWMSTLSECQSSPFDLGESESELVAGTLVEYSSVSFVFLYLAEYTNMLSMSTLTSVLFLGGSVFSLKTIFIVILFIWISATVPRLSWDQLLNFGFTKMLPFSISYLILSYSMYSIFM